jgi:hypothetical protein
MQGLQRIQKEHKKIAPAPTKARVLLNLKIHEGISTLNSNRK